MCIRDRHSWYGGLDPPYQLCRGWVKVAHVPHCRATNPTCRRRRPLSLGLAIVRELQGDVEVGFAKHGDHRLQVVLRLGAHPQLAALTALSDTLRLTNLSRSTSRAALARSSLFARMSIFSVPDQAMNAPTPLKS